MTDRHGNAAARDLLITADDAWMFNEGAHTRLYTKLGAHPLPGGCASFGVWAPNAITHAAMPITTAINRRFIVNLPRPSPDARTSRSLCGRRRERNSRSVLQCRFFETRRLA